MSDRQRLSIQDVDSDAYQPMFAMENYIHSGSLGEPILVLVKLRASQLNGCAWCLDMHTREARKASVEERKIDVLAGWREAPHVYADRERVALGLTEEVTLIGRAGVSDDVGRDETGTFDSGEFVRLLMAIAAINVWNRLAISTRQDLPEHDE